MSHLWEAKHPYYWNEGNFYSNDRHHEYDSWESFLEEWGDADEDYNLLCRWDWRPAVDDDGEVIQPVETGTLQLGYVLQRKAIICSCAVAVTADDEPAVREWLSKKHEHMKALWSGLNEAIAAAPEEKP